MHFTLTQNTRNLVAIVVSELPLIFGFYLQVTRSQVVGKNSRLLKRKSLVLITERGYFNVLQNTHEF